MTKNKHITLSEYQYLYIGDAVSCERALSKTQFDVLETFVLKNSHAGFGNYLKLSHIKGLGKVLQAQNYIGIIQMHDGTTIEILPKIANDKDNDGVRKIVVKMLKTLRDSPLRKSILPA